MRLRVEWTLSIRLRDSGSGGIGTNRARSRGNGQGLGRGDGCGVREGKTPWKAHFFKRKKALLWHDFKQFKKGEWEKSKRGYVLELE